MISDDLILLRKNPVGINENWYWWIEADGWYCKISTSVVRVNGWTLTKWYFVGDTPRCSTSRVGCLFPSVCRSFKMTTWCPWSWSVATVVIYLTSLLPIRKRVDSQSMLQHEFRCIFFSEAPWLSVEPLNHQVNFEVTKSWWMKTTAKVTKNIKELEL